MTIKILELNWSGILLAFASYSFLGALWFTLLFKKQYAISLGKENEALQNKAPIFFIGPSVCVLFITMTSDLLMHALGVNSPAQAALFAMIAGIGYLFANTVNIAINPNIPKPILYGMISGTFHLTGMIIACMIIFAMH